MKTAIVTGAYGYIGSVLCKLLKEDGYYVVGIDNDPNSQLDWINNADRVKYCDDFLADDFVSDRALHLCNEYKDATVFHLAANSLLGPSATDPLLYFENNTSKTLKLIGELRPSNKFIFASTAATYGISDRILKETSRLDPPNNYGKSKLWTEQMLDSYYALGHIRAVSFRFFCVVGAYGNVGQLPETPHIVNQLCDRSMKKEPFIINGTDYDTPDGTTIRDYLHVVDVCRALIHADKYLEDKEPCHHKFNLGTNEGYSVRQMIDCFSKACAEVEVTDGPRRVGDPPFLVANPIKFIKQTGFKYLYGADDLDKMMLSAWEYRNDNFRGK
jgi:UDP-glucose-4-epimerase GalE